MPKGRGPNQGPPQGPPQQPKQPSAEGSSTPEKKPQSIRAEVKSVSKDGIMTVHVEGGGIRIIKLEGRTDVKQGMTINIVLGRYVREALPNGQTWIWHATEAGVPPAPKKEAGKPRPPQERTPPTKPVPEALARPPQEHISAEENIFGTLPFKYDQEGQPIRDYVRTVATLTERKDGSRYFANKDGSVLLEGRDNPSKTEFGTLQVGTMVAFERKRSDGGGPLEKIDTLGLKDTFAAELRRLEYTLDRGRVPQREVLDEIRRLEKVGEGMIQKELAPGRLVKAFEGDWMKNYKFGENRVDFRHIPLIAVDPEGAMDHDDILGIYEHVDAEGRKTGTVSVIISISDTNHFIRPGTVLEREGREHGTSIYPIGGVMPMTPPVLSGGVDHTGVRKKGLCSLAEGEDRLTNTMVFTFHKNGNLIGKPFKCASASRSAKTHTYEEAEEIRTNKRASPYTNLIQTLDRLAEIQEARREKFGQIEVDGGEEWRLISGKLVHKEKNRMNDVVAAWMISANMEQGNRIEEAREREGLPGFFRVHPAPPVEELQGAAQMLGDTELAEYCQLMRDGKGKKGKKGELSAKLAREKGAMPFENFAMRRILAYKEVTPVEKASFEKEAQQTIVKTPNESNGAWKERIRMHAWLLTKRRENQRATLVNQATRTLREKAVASTVPGIHFGLSARKYAFFTSPIRRDFDREAEELDRSRQLIEQGINISTYNTATEGELERLAAHLVKREREAKKIERLTYRMYSAEQLKPLVGKTIKAFISEAAPSYGNKNKIYGIRVQIELPPPNNEYAEEFFVRLGAFDGFPDTIRGAQRFEKKEIEVQLLSASVADGEVTLKFIPPQQNRLGLNLARPPKPQPKTKAPGAPSKIRPKA